MLCKHNLRAINIYLHSRQTDKQRAIAIKDLLYWIYIINNNVDIVLYTCICTSIHMLIHNVTGTYTSVQWHVQLAAPENGLQRGFHETGALSPEDVSLDLSGCIWR